MHVTFIGSTAYRAMMENEKRLLEAAGHMVRMPAFDDFAGDELAICRRNFEAVEWADEVYMFWDGRSPGTVLDLGMVFALHKPLRVGFLNKKTLANFVRQYEASGRPPC
jgi:nucleoside 2-deoxyribosyltransferase